LIADPPIPGMPVSLDWHTESFTIAHRASNSALMCPISRRVPASSQALPPSWPTRAASCASVPTKRWSWIISLANAVPRSKRSVTLVTRQPSFSAPTRFATGTRTRSRNTSENSPSPASVRSGRISMPGESIDRISQVMPPCFGESGSVRTRSSQKSAAWAKDVQILCPETT
jgi:hypothetical protein